MIYSLIGLFWLSLMSMSSIGVAGPLALTQESAPAVEAAPPPTAAETKGEAAGNSPSNAPSPPQASPTPSASTPKAGAPPATKRPKTKVGKRMYAVIQVTQGDKDLGKIKIRLFREYAPKTVENFVGLAQGTLGWIASNTGRPTAGTKIKRRYYDGLLFHRVVPGFVIQGGDPLGTGRGGPGHVVPDEITTQLSHGKAGMVAMANKGPGTNGSQFYITLAPKKDLDGTYTIFGEVVSGMSTVEAIAAVPVDNTEHRPISPVIMKRVDIVDE